MLEVCETVADQKCALEIHPLSIGGKDNPPRLVFSVRRGPAVCASLIDMGNRFRLINSEVDVVPPDAPLLKLPVARAVWVPRPDLKTAAAAWILAGGAHHTAFSQSVSVEMLEDFSTMADVEFLAIGKDTRIPEFQKELRWNDLYYSLARGF
jgi:L-arabinose isomerase